MASQQVFPLRIRGVHGSPYSMKMRAVLRYRQIPFKWVPQGSKWDDLPPFPLIPAVSFPDATGAFKEGGAPTVAEAAKTAPATLLLLGGEA